VLDIVSGKIERAVGEKNKMPANIYYKHSSNIIQANTT
jgi:hypothetical protein